MARLSQADKIAGREPLWMHPGDAAARGLVEGDVVRLRSRRGSCLAGLHVTDLIRPGVVQLATGAWYDPEHPGDPSSLCKHGNCNVVTLDKGTSKLAQAPISQTTLVEVTRCETPPPVTAFESPPISGAG